MTTCRRFCCNDLLRVAPQNFNATEDTFNLHINLSSLACWPDLFHVADYPGGILAGYIYGTSQGTGDFCHGQVSRITTTTGDQMDVARLLLEVFREHCDRTYKVYFLNIGVGFNDENNQEICQRLGFVKYRRDKDIMEMRIPLPRDVNKKCLVPPKPIKRERFSFWRR